MNSVYKILLVPVLILLLASTALSQEKSDNWFAKDKLKHFAVSALFSCGTTFVSNRHFDYKKEKSMIIGFSFSVAIGGAKEAVDSKKPEETSSVKDFIWDMAGAAAGALIVGFSL